MISNLYDDARRAFADGASDAAADLCTQWLDARPNDIDGLFLLALIRDKQQQHDAALALYDRILALGVRAHEVWLNRSNTLCYLDRYGEALQSLDQALALRPEQAGLHVNRGNILLNLDQINAAIASYDDALARDPASVDAYKYRGKARDVAGDLGGAIDDFDKALQLTAPKLDPYAFRELCFLALRACDWPRVEWCRERIVTDEKVDWVEPLALCAYDVGPGVLKRCAAATTRYYQRMSARSLSPRRIVLDKNRRLRIAYVTSDLFSHAGAELLVNLIETHDRDCFEIFGLALGANLARIRASDPTGILPIDQRMLKAFDHLHDVANISDRAAALFMQELGIDIALDVNGYTKGSRPGIFMLRPAPVQINYLGFPGTMASTHMDYIIADPIVLPLEEADFFAEKVVHIDGCYQPNDRHRAFAAAPPRSALGLPEESFVYASLNNSFKISRSVFRSWMNILHAVPGSVLWLLVDTNATQNNLRAAAQGLGIDANRIVFAPRVSIEQHIGRMARADLFLDTLPYNSHTTGSESLWAGLPMLTCTGGTFASRVGASILAAAGLPELITHSLPEYERRAIAIGLEPSLAAGLKAKLQQQRLNCRLFDIDNYRWNIERAFLHMAEMNARDQAPQSFRIADLL